ncbi:sentrin/sumo-specific protease senp7 [Culex quinquefasciatus]|uniref:Sentrin/sumo-specific protease senp7 n=1 Tax=Culex quinquefasciatus TaxID=7176 RepID=B0XFL5_CULQU|nr:sentrin/sumo-specific protease senp7 [Culex quinquefasciatus]|eukprot:XP_001868437.1 sentrin/sumo-specific protease senp7 [Culex quinquefasciatus]
MAVIKEYTYAYRYFITELGAGHDGIIIEAGQDQQLLEVVKAVVHFSTALNGIFLYTLPSCGFYIRESLEMGLPDDPLPYFNPSKSILKSIFSTERIAVISANELLARSCGTGTVGSKGTENSSNNTTTNASTGDVTEIRKTLIYPHGKGDAWRSISI